MRILRGSILEHPSSGRTTLQIPTMAIGIGVEPSVQYEDIPDEWVCELRHQVPVTGREQGFLFLTQTGWEANRDAIRQAFESSENARGTWEDFERLAERHFLEVERKTRTKLWQLQAKVNELQRHLPNG